MSLPGHRLHLRGIQFIPIGDLLRTVAPENRLPLWLRCEDENRSFVFVRCGRGNKVAVEFR